MSMPPPAGPPGSGMSGMPPPGYGAPPGKPKTLLPTIGAILLIVAAIDGMVFWAYVAFIGSALSGMFGSFGDALRAIFIICGIIAIVFGIIALLGGIMAIRRKMWALGIVGSILGLFFIGWVGEASLLSFIALILLVIGRKEF